MRPMWKVLKLTVPKRTLFLHPVPTQSHPVSLGFFWCEAHTLFITKVAYTLHSPLAYCHKHGLGTHRGAANPRNDLRGHDHHKPDQTQMKRKRKQGHVGQDSDKRRKTSSRFHTRSNERQMRCCEQQINSELLPNVKYI